jgi:hypothetical protein
MRLILPFVFMYLAAGGAYQRCIARRVSCTLDEVREVMILLGKLEGMDSNQEQSSCFSHAGSVKGRSSAAEEKEKSPVSSKELPGLGPSITESESVVAKSTSTTSHEDESVLEHSVQVTSSQAARARDLSVESFKSDSHIKVTSTLPNLSPSPEACLSSPGRATGPVSQKGEGPEPSNVPRSTVASRRKRRRKRGKTACNSGEGVSGSDSGSDTKKGQGLGSWSWSWSWSGSGSGSRSEKESGSGSRSGKEAGSGSRSGLSLPVQRPSPASSGSGSGSGSPSRQCSWSGSWSGAGADHGSGSDSEFDIPPVRIPPESTLFEADLGFPCANNATHGHLTEADLATILGVANLRYPDQSHLAVKLKGYVDPIRKPEEVVATPDFES